MKKLLNIIFGLVAVFMPLNSVHADLWYPSANRLTPVSPAWGLKVPAITTGGGTECLQISSTGVFSAAGAGCLTTSSLSSPLTTINVSGGEIDVNTSFSFDWFANHRWQSTSAIVIGNPDVPLSNGFVLKNSDSGNAPFLKFESGDGSFYVGFNAPNFDASNPTVLWTLPEQDASGVWQSDGGGFLSIAPVVLTTQVTGVLPYANGGCNSSTSFTAGSTIFAGSTGCAQDNANNFWDDTNNRQGYGTNTPSYRLHVSSGDVLVSYFTGSGASTRIGINHASNTGFGLYVGGAIKWSFASVNGGGGGANPDAVLYNDQTSINTIWADGNNDNVSINGIPGVTTNKFTVNSTYSTSASRIAYFVGTSGTSGLEVRTNGQAQYMARSSTHTDRELRFQTYSDGHIYISAQGLTGTITANLNFMISADSGVNNGFIGFRNVTIGNEVTRIYADATNDDPMERTFLNRVATTNNTQTTLHTFTIPASTTYSVHAIVTARRTGGTGGTAEDGANYDFICTFKNVAGTATQIGTATPISTQEDNVNFDATCDVTAGTARIRVTGDTNNNVTWHMVAKVYSLST